MAVKNIEDKYKEQNEQLKMKLHKYVIENGELENKINILNDQIKKQSSSM